MNSKVLTLLGFASKAHKLSFGMYDAHLCVDSGHA